MFRLLQTAIEKKAKFVIFPEFYLPIAWLQDVVTFAMKTQITIITGIEYIKNRDKAYNYVSLIQPFIQDRFKDVFVICREKNFYSPHEQRGLSYHGLLCVDQKQPNYQIINNGFFTYSFMLCFEITDIVSRANLKAKANMLFIPEFIRDTIYFESIIKSAARDLHCFMVQANTSLYGDSRISAPYKSEVSDIIKVKGGDNDMIMIGTLDVQELIDFQAMYYSNLNEEIKINNFKQRKKGSKFVNKKSKIKPLPPRFN